MRADRNQLVAAYRPSRIPRQHWRRSAGCAGRRERVSHGRAYDTPGEVSERSWRSARGRHHRARGRHHRTRGTRTGRSCGSALRPRSPPIRCARCTHHSGRRAGCRADAAAIVPVARAMARSQLGRRYSRRSPCWPAARPTAVGVRATRRRDATARLAPSAVATRVARSFTVRRRACVARRPRRDGSRSFGHPHRRALFSIFSHGVVLSRIHAARLRRLSHARLTQYCTLSR